MIKSYKGFRGQKKMFDIVKNSMHEDETFWERACYISDRIYRKHGVDCFEIKISYARQIMKKYYPEWAKEQHLI